MVFMPCPFSLNYDMWKEGIEKQETVQQTDYTKVTCNYKLHYTGHFFEIHVVFFNTQRHGWSFSNTGKCT